MSTYLSICLSKYLSLCLSVFMSFCLSVLWVSMYLASSSYLSLRRSSGARLPFATETQNFQPRHRKQRQNARLTHWVPLNITFLGCKSTILQAYGPLPLRRFSLWSVSSVCILENHRDFSQLWFLDVFGLLYPTQQRQPHTFRWENQHQKVPLRQHPLDCTLKKADQSQRHGRKVTYNGPSPTKNHWNHSSNDQYTFVSK